MSNHMTASTSAERPPARRARRQRFLIEVDLPPDWDSYSSDISGAVEAGVEGTRATVIDYGYLINVEPPKVNRERLIELATWLGAEHAKAELGLPSEWYQGSWVGLRQNTNGNWCGTTACGAGHVVLKAGARMAVRDPSTDSGLRPVSDLSDLMQGEAELADHMVFTPDDEPIGISLYARDLLGLTETQATRLFSGDNDFGQMMTIIGDILAEAAADEALAEAAVAEEPEPEPERVGGVLNGRQLKEGVTPERADELHGPAWRTDHVERRCNYCFEDAPIPAPPVPGPALPYLTSGANQDDPWARR